MATKFLYESIKTYTWPFYALVGAHNSFVSFLSIITLYEGTVQNKFIYFLVISWLMINYDINNLHAQNQNNKLTLFLVVTICHTLFLVENSFLVNQI